MKKFLRVLFVLLIMAGIGYAMYYEMNLSPGTIVLTGVVTTDDVIVAAQIPGRLQELKVNQGDPVKKGELLAVIQPAEQKADLSYYENSQKQAATQVSQSEADLKYQEQQLQDLIAQANANLASAQAQVKQAEADLENATLTFQRESQQYKMGSESVQAYDQARTGLAAQQAKVESLRKQVDAATAAISIAQSNEQQVKMRQDAVEIRKHQLAAAAAQTDKAQVLLDYTQIDAPIDGIVDVRAALQGEVINPGQAIVTLVNPDDLWVRVDVEESYIDQIHLGDKLVVKLPGGKEREGAVFFRGVDADYATQRDVSRTKRDIKTFEVRLRCDNKDRDLALGMTAYVTLPVGK